MKPFRITLHSAATKNGVRVDIEEIRKWHKAKGWSDVGYHLVIQPDGEVQRGRPLNMLGAHVEGENMGNIGICLPGTDKFPLPQWESLRYQIDGIVQIYQIPPWEIFAHNQFKSAIAQGKICPGVSINRLLAWYIGHRYDAIEPHIFRG